ncbi:MAG: hypothetical protein NZL96_01460 [Patescibacteria group bacterium]|nr:hypothetical protein [Patescibacteria group bacterium]
MENSQLLVIILITIITVLTTSVGIQLIFILKEIRGVIRKISRLVEEEIDQKNDESNHQQKKDKPETVALPRQSTLLGLLNRIRFFYRQIQNDQKKFF